MAKVDKWLKRKNLEQITRWARDEKLNISDIAGLMDISASTFRQWRHDYPEIAEAFEEGRRVIDEKVENSFFKMCTGFVQKVMKNYKVRRKEYNEHGKVIAEYDEVIQREEEEFIPPSVVAQKFYLCNRMPDKYRVENAALPPGNEGENDSGVVMLPEVSDSTSSTASGPPSPRGEGFDGEPIQEAEIID